MNLSTQLKNIRQSAEAIGQRIDALKASDNLDRRGTKPHAFRFSYSTTPTSNSLDRPIYACKVMGGLNELDAEIHLRQHLNKNGLHLRSILATEEVR